jgi:hypothetical protein
MDQVSKMLEVLAKGEGEKHVCVCVCVWGGGVSFFFDKRNMSVKNIGEEEYGKDVW